MNYIKFTHRGVVKSEIKEATDENWGSVTSTIKLSPEFAPGLLGLDSFSHMQGYF